MNRLVAESGEQVELDVAADTGIPGLFGSEAVRARAPLPATVTATLDPVSVGDLRTVRAATPHLFLTVRRMRALRAQYDLRPDPELTDDVVVTAVLTPEGNGCVERLRLTLLWSPDEVDSVASAAPAVTCLSLDCLRDREWRDRWLATLRARTPARDQ